MFKELGPALRLTLVLTLLTGFIYPAAVTTVAQIVFPQAANGSLISRDGKIAASRLIGQPFSSPGYFHSRPSSAGGGYDASASGGSNLGPTSRKLLYGTTKVDGKNNEVVEFDGIRLRTVHYCFENGIPYDSSIPLDEFKTQQGELDDVKLIKAFNKSAAPLVFMPKIPIPADAVTASASGLDPHISPANAELQAARVARARRVSEEQVQKLIAGATEGRDLGFLGEPRVNVTLLNIALDERFQNPK